MNNERYLEAEGFAARDDEKYYEMRYKATDAHFCGEMTDEEYREIKAECDAYFDLRNKRFCALEHACKLNAWTPSTARFVARVAPKIKAPEPLTGEEQQLIDELFAEMEEESK